MIQRELLGSAQVPGGERLDLYRHDADFMIVLGHNELMSTRRWGSEVALAEMALDRLPHAAAPHLLIGGYGMGFTLRAALARMGSGGRVTVAELVPEIVEWARGPMAKLAAGCLDDHRVTLRMGDVSTAIRERPHAWDAILLDVDNGPSFLIHDENARVYSADFLATCLARLAPAALPEPVREP